MALMSMTIVEYQAQRIKLAFNKTTRLELFEEFGSYNARLRDILGSSDRLAGLRRTRVSAKTASINSGLWKFWNHANSVFELLTDALSCKCQAFHHANLLLQHRVVSTVSFRVIFWYKLHLEGQTPWTWQDTNIKLLEESLITINVPTAPVTPPIPALMPAPQQAPKAPTAIAISVKDVQKTHRKSFLSKFRHGKDVKIEGNLPKTKLPHTPAQVPPQSPPPHSGTSPKPPKPRVAFVDPPSPSIVEDTSNPKITNLCARIASCTADLQKYGCLRGEARQYLVEPMCKADNQPQKYVTLEALLSRDRPIDLSRRHRYYIAYTLASSHVQLHPTPWLKTKWSKKDILFLYNTDAPETICIEQPFISRSLSKAIQINTPISTQPYTNTYTFQDSVRALGILLLELCFGTAIEDHRMRRNLNTDDEQLLQVINYGVATKWCRDVVEEAGLE